MQFLKHSTQIILYQALHVSCVNSILLYQTLILYAKKDNSIYIYKVLTVCFDILANVDYRFLPIKVLDVVYSFMCVICLTV